MNRPWYRAGTNDWVVTIAGRQVPIGKDPRFVDKRPSEKPKQPPKEIEEKYHALMSRRGLPEERTFTDACEKYLEHLDTNPENRKSSRLHLKWFGDFVPQSATKPVGKMRVGELKKHHLTEYLATKPHWKPNTRRFAITRILASLNYCTREQYILANPLKGYERPRVERRKDILTDAEFDQLCAAAFPEFRDLLICLRELGARPGELYDLKIEHCDFERGVILVKNKIKAVTGEPFRPVFLTEKAREVMKGRAGARTEGNVFLNSAGTPWDRHTGQQQMRRLRTRLGLGKGCTLYALRHRFLSAAINDNNVNIALLAVQAGHTDTKRILKTYLHTDVEAMRKAVEQAAKRKE